MTGQDWSKSRVAACRMTGTSMLVIKGPASTVLPQLDQAQQGAAIQIKGWHPTATIDRTLQQRSYGGDQPKGWHPTAIIGQILQQKSYGRDQNAGIIVSQTGAGTVLLQLGQALQEQHPKRLAPYCHN